MYFHWMHWKVISNLTGKETDLANITWCWCSPKLEIERLVALSNVCVTGEETCYLVWWCANLIGDDTDMVETEFYSREDHHWPEKLWHAAYVEHE